MLRIAICEDEFKQRNMLKNILTGQIKENNLDAKINDYESGEQLINSIKDNSYRFDIIFLDIQMKNISGIDTAKIIRETNKIAIIIFVTGLMEYVFEGYNVRAFNYILKPFKIGKIAKVFKEALDNLDMIKNDMYIVNLKDKTHKISFSDIMYFVSDKRLIRLICTQGEYEFYSQLDNVEKELSNRNFIRCHQRYLINLSNISSMEQNHAITILGYNVPISRNRYKETLIAFAKQILR
ncbi:LytR/AlgR family response regulator transcription factor [Clostridium tagluense]|uniref:LytR/AlgR family response regulator transcription factor n=1 Tax=Clostridium tagluense TaxID=360422 RepID=UPI001C6F3CBA|nr:LytTR family DNA-binding domain-containing protein [Clostridium tagluense]MBW9155798.1 LytTR family DNA-binding domain-containing protein [Clostridium tagluense]WLC63854.1 LytTR family DNA-binding domain-containing protein [Clostridium tagluense]